ncbi:hypothetical protein PINS_up011611 [Pythium insidiosum]|nr:hypothetical protein PINS_up011611 [Pythium insidiosum]
MQSTVECVSAFHWSVLSGHLALVEPFLKVATLDVDVRDAVTWNTTLQMAPRRRYSVISSSAAPAPAVQDSEDGDGDDGPRRRLMPCLHAAIAWGNDVSVVDALLTHGATVAATMETDADGTAETETYV